MRARVSAVVTRIVGKKGSFWGRVHFFVISAWQGPREFGSSRQSAARVFCSMIKLRMDSRRRICLFFWKTRNAHFSLATVLELRSSRSGFDGQLCVCMLSVIIRTGGVEAFFSPMLSTCALSRKMEQFPSLSGKV